MSLFYINNLNKKRGSFNRTNQIKEIRRWEKWNLHKEY